MNKQGKWRPNIAAGQPAIRREGKFFVAVCRDDEEADEIETALVKAFCDARQSEPEVKILYRMLNAFVFKVKERVEAKYQEGFRGWDSPKEFRSYVATFKTKVAAFLEDVFSEKHVLDIAAWAAFFWNIQNIENDIGGTNESSTGGDTSQQNQANGGNECARDTVASGGSDKAGSDQGNEGDKSKDSENVL